GSSTTRVRLKPPPESCARAAAGFSGGFGITGFAVSGGFGGASCTAGPLETMSSGAAKKEVLHRLSAPASVALERPVQRAEEAPEPGSPADQGLSATPKRTAAASDVGERSKCPCSLGYMTRWVDTTLIVTGWMRAACQTVMRQRKLHCMRVFGVDCGTEFTGYGVGEVDCDARTPKLRYLCAGAVKLSKKETTCQRLAQVYAELTALMHLWSPEMVAIEEVFFSANAKSALKLGQVRGVAMLAAANCGLAV